MLEDSFTIPTRSGELDCLKHVMSTCGYEDNSNNAIDKLLKKIERYKNRGILPNEVKPQKHIAMLYTA